MAHAAQQAAELEKQSHASLRVASQALETVFPGASVAHLATIDGRLLVAEKGGALRVLLLAPGGLTVASEAQRIALAPRRALGGVCVDAAPGRTPRVVVADTSQNVLHLLEAASLSRCAVGTCDAPQRGHRAKKPGKRR